MNKDRELVNLLAHLVRKVVVEDVYLDRTLRDFFKDKKVTSPYLRATINLYAHFTLRLWFHFGGENENLISIVQKALEVPANRIAEYSSAITAPDFPQWFIDLAKEELPDRWEKELIALSGKPERYLRTNTLKTTTPELLHLLSMQEVSAKAEPTLANAIKVVGGKEVFGTKSFKDGLFEVQDVASQQVAPFLLKNYKGHGLVVDACAGNGGKSLHLGTLMKNKGRIISMDIYEHKLEELKHRAHRNGITNIETRHISTTKVVKRMADKVDFLLLDVPCSGTGVFRRNPESKLRLKLADIDNVRAQQADILARYSRMVKPGGELVYATCSILPSENRLQVEKFLAANTSFSLDDDCSVLPSSGGDGFYMARLKRAK